MKKILALILVLLTVGVARAQSATTSVAWFYANEVASVVNTSYVQVVKVDGVVITTPTLKPTCVQAGLDVNCTIPIGTLASGPHNLTVSATMNNVTAETNILNLNLGTAPKNPTNFRYQIVINVP